MLNLGNTQIVSLSLGAIQAKAAYLGSKLAWSSAPAWLRFDILADDTSIDIVDDSGTLEAPDLEYSVDDGATWTQWVPGTDFPHEMAGAVVYVRAGATGNTRFADPNNSNAYWHFTSDDLFSVSGNIMYLLSRDGSTGLSDYCFYKLFTGCTMLVDASGLKLPATTLANSCYCDMFNGCTSLTSAPKLPATTLASLCYAGMFLGCTALTSAPALPATTLASNCCQGMFMNCTSLTTAPVLPATTLANDCYRSMFQNCSSLTTAPALPATTVADGCYCDMFNSCSSLTTAPVLPATTLANDCYAGMFLGCTSLTTAPKLLATTLGTQCYQGMFFSCTSLSSVEVAFTTWPSNGATNSWLQNVAASGTFTCPAELPDIRGTSNIPSGWTKAEPDTYLAFTATQANSTVRLDKIGSPHEAYFEYSYDKATWNDITWSGTAGNTMTLANVGDKVYMRAKTENQNIGSSFSNYYKFVMSGKIAASGNIQSLLKADCSRTDAPTFCYVFIFKDCTSLTTAPELPATTLYERCYSDMFTGCTSLTAAPQLPVTTIAAGCYASMFSHCTSLTTALTTLPATTLADNCYQGMFQYCSSLTTAPTLPAQTPVQACYDRIFNHCSNLSSIEVGLTSWNATNATYSWLNGVAASGTFTCPSTLPDIRGISNIPSGWTKVDAA